MSQPPNTDQLAFPAARHTDPPTSHEAAQLAKAGNTDLVRAIRSVVATYGPQTSWEIAEHVMDRHGARWGFDSIRTACARAGLIGCGKIAKSPRGNKAMCYALIVEDTPAL